MPRAQTARILMLIAGSIASLAPDAAAQPAGPGGINFWNTPTSGSWYDPMAWNGILPSQGGVPDSTQTAHMSWDTPYTVQAINGGAQCHHLSLGTSAVTLHLAATTELRFNTYGTQIDNRGTILMGGPGSTGSVAFIINNNCTIGENGTLRMAPEPSGSASIIGTLFNVGYLMINGAQHSIEGTGQVRVRLQNLGTVNANVADRALALNGAFLVENHGTMRASQGGTLTLSPAGGFTQSASGRVIAEHGSAILLQTSLAPGFSGGQMSTQGTGIVYIGSQGVQIQDTTITAGSTLRTIGNTGLNIGPAGLTNHGLINLGGTGFLASQVGQSAELRGTGRVQLEGGQLGVFLDGFSYNVVNAAEHTIGGFGSLQAGLTNLGTIAADRNGLTSGPGELLLQQAPKTNHGLMAATNGGSLRAFNLTLTQSSTGRLHASDQSWIMLQSARIVGGQISTSGNAAVYAGGSGDELVSVTVLPNSRVISPCGRTLTLSGNISNTGTIIAENNGCGAGFSNLAAQGTVISGNGSILLASIPGSLTCTLQGGSGMTLGLDQALRGTGRTSGNILTQGIIAPSALTSNTDPIGHLEFTSGSIQLGAASSTHIDIASSQFADRITGTGNLQLGGELRLSLTSGFQPISRTEWTVIQVAGGLTGSFNSLALPDRFYITQTADRIIATFCPADFNSDGVTDLFDYLDFVAALANQDPTGDYNADTVVDFFDYLDFVADFSQGC
ncbi:MAG: hypothetical protein KGS45_02950 [Planctomycetes bacterium]|nr:hypothetical protein [Planctomycetota bacterium]